MNIQPPSQQPKSSSNGYGRRRHDRDGGGARADHKSQPNKLSSTKSMHAGGIGGAKHVGPSHDRLLYMATCLIGQHVEVQVKNGSLYTGIFHATNADKDFGIILKMARMTKDGTVKGQKADGETPNKAPLKTLIIPARELVQIVAQDVPVTSDGLSDELQHQKQQDLMIDSFISNSRHVDLGRVLEPWVPDEDDPQGPVLENVFDGHWNRNWDQFATNETLFGVKSTFNEELYTTKLERGPRMKELEREAFRLAREIEGQETQDPHLAEERGLHLHESFDIDEETKYSSVYRGRVTDDSGYEEDEDIIFNSRNTETFGDSSSSATEGGFGGLTSGKRNEGVLASSSFSIVDDGKKYQSSSETDLYDSGGRDATKLPSELLIGIFPPVKENSRVQESSSTEFTGNTDSETHTARQTLTEDAKLLHSEDTQTSVSSKKEVSGKKETSPDAPPSDASLKEKEEKRPASELLEARGSGEAKSAESRQRPGSSASSVSEHAGAASASNRAAGLTPSSSMGSLSSEKSTLNPNAKEFKFNPNAKSFVPTQAPLRPPSPLSDGSSFYFQPNMGAVSHMHGMPVGVGVGPSFMNHQPVIYNPQVAGIHSQQAYIHPTAPQYGQQQVFYGHPRPPYMSNFPHDMHYKGRDF